MTRARLPRMIHEFGRYWPQPKNLCERVTVFETHVTISEADWLLLPRYESSIPSGAYPGKAWRRGKLMCWYGPERIKGHCRIVYTRALVTI